MGSGSSREPTPTHTPTETERVVSIGSTATVNPLSRTTTRSVIEVLFAVSGDDDVRRHHHDVRSLVQGHRVHRRVLRQNSHRN